MVSTPAARNIPATTKIAIGIQRGIPWVSVPRFRWTATFLANEQDQQGEEASGRYPLSGRWE